MSLTWNTTILPNPTNWDDAEDYIGTQRRWADGSLVNDTITTKRTVAIRWELLSVFNRNQIYNLATAFAATTIFMPWGDTWTVTPVPGSYSADAVPGTALWNVSATVRLQ
jgi:hypothetical protein